MDLASLRISVDVSSSGTASSQFQTAMGAMSSAANQAVGNITSGFDRLKSSLFSVRSEFEGVVASLGLQRIAETYNQFQRIDIALTAATGSAKIAAGEFQFLQETANKFGMDALTLGTAYAKILEDTKGTELQGERTRKMFEGITAAVATFGGSTQQAVTTLNIMNVLLSRTNVTGEQMINMLSGGRGGGGGGGGRGIPDLLKDIAEGFGYVGPAGVQAFEQILKAGALTKTQVIDVMIDVLENKFSKSGAEAANTVGGAWTRMMNTLKGLMIDVGESGFGKALIDGMDRITKAISTPEFREAAAQFGRLLGEAIEYLIPLLEWLAQHLDLVKDAFWAMIGLEVLSWLGGIALGIAQLTLGIKTLLNLDMVGWLISMGREAMVAADATSALARATETVGAAGAAKGVATAGETGAETVAEEAGLGAGIGGLTGALSGVGGAILEFLLNPLTLALAAVAAIGVALYEAKDDQVQLNGEAYKMSDIYRGVWESIKEGIREVGEDLKNSAEGWWEIIKAGGSFVWDGFKDTALIAFQVLDTAFGGLIETMIEGIEKAGASLVTAFAEKGKEIRLEQSTVALQNAGSLPNPALDPNAYFKELDRPLSLTYGAFPKGAPAPNAQGFFSDEQLQQLGKTREQIMEIDKEYQILQGHIGQSKQQMLDAGMDPKAILQFESALNRTEQLTNPQLMPNAPKGLGSEASGQQSYLNQEGLKLDAQILSYQRLRDAIGQSAEAEARMEGDKAFDQWVESHQAKLAGLKGGLDDLKAKFEQVAIAKVQFEESKAFERVIEKQQTDLEAGPKLLAAAQQGPEIYQKVTQELQLEVELKEKFGLLSDAELNTARANLETMIQQNRQIAEAKLGQSDQQALDVQLTFAQQGGPKGTSAAAARQLGLETVQFALQNNLATWDSNTHSIQANDEASKNIIETHVKEEVQLKQLAAAQKEIDDITKEFDPDDAYEEKLKAIAFAVDHLKLSTQEAAEAQYQAAIKWQESMEKMLLATNTFTGGATAAFSKLEREAQDEAKPVFDSITKGFGQLNTQLDNLFEGKKISPVKIFQDASAPLVDMVVKQAIMEPLEKTFANAFGLQNLNKAEIQKPTGSDQSPFYVVVKSGIPALPPINVAAAPPGTISVPQPGQAGFVGPLTVEQAAAAGGTAAVSAATNTLSGGAFSGPGVLRSQTITTGSTTNSTDALLLRLLGLPANNPVLPTLATGNTNVPSVGPTLPTPGLSDLNALTASVTAQEKGGWLPDEYQGRGMMMDPVLHSLGGVTHKPQLALFGEGSTPEAYVPMPSGKVPVRLDGQGGAAVMLPGGRSLPTEVVPFADGGVNSAAFFNQNPAEMIRTYQTMPAATKQMLHLEELDQLAKEAISSARTAPSVPKPEIPMPGMDPVTGRETPIPSTQEWQGAQERLPGEVSQELWESGRTLTGAAGYPKIKAGFSDLVNAGVFDPNAPITEAQQRQANTGLLNTLRGTTEAATPFLIATAPTVAPERLLAEAALTTAASNTAQYGATRFGASQEGSQITGILGSAILPIGGIARTGEGLEASLAESKLLSREGFDQGLREGFGEDYSLAALRGGVPGGELSPSYSHVPVQSERDKIFSFLREQGATKFEPLGSGIENNVFDIGSDKVVKLGDYRYKEPPDLPEVLPHQAVEFYPRGNWKSPYHAVIQEKADLSKIGPNEVRDMTATLGEKGWVWDDHMGNLGRVGGELKVIDSGGMHQPAGYGDNYLEQVIGAAKENPQFVKENRQFAQGGWMMQPYEDDYQKGGMEGCYAQGGVAQFKVNKYADGGIQWNPNTDAGWSAFLKAEANKSHGSTGVGEAVMSMIGVVEILDPKLMNKLLSALHVIKPPTTLQQLAEGKGDKVVSALSRRDLDQLTTGERGNSDLPRTSPTGSLPGISPNAPESFNQVTSISFNPNVLAPASFSPVVSAPTSGTASSESITRPYSGMLGSTLNTVTYAPPTPAVSPTETPSYPSNVFVQFASGGKMEASGTGTANPMSSGNSSGTGTWQANQDPGWKAYESAVQYNTPSPFWADFLQAALMMKQLTRGLDFSKKEQQDSLGQTPVQDALPTGPSQVPVSAGPDVVPQFTYGSGGMAPFPYWNLPRFEDGGISTTPAIFGEAGPEAAVPLPDGRSIPVDLRGGGKDGNVTQNYNMTMNVHGVKDTDSFRRTQGQTTAGLRDGLRRMGKV